MASLKILLPDGNEITNSLEGELITIGRLPENDITIDDASVSSKHAEVSMSESGPRLVDLDSTNGIHVNGEVITEKVLSEGDTILIGHVPAQYGEKKEAAPQANSPAESPAEKSASDIAAGWDDESDDTPDNTSSEVSTDYFTEKDPEKDPLKLPLMLLASIAFLACLATIILSLVKLSA